MAFQDKGREINWKVHFSSPIEQVYEALTNDNGRKYFAGRELLPQERLRG